MQLDKILNSDSTEDELNNYIYLEQFVNEGSPSGFTSVHQVPDEFRPGICHDFSLPFIQKTRKDILAYLDSPSEDVSNLVHNARDTITFYLHPVLADQLSVNDIDGTISVSPTASSRTVIVNSTTPTFIKLHYQGLLGRVDRKMSNKRVRGGTLISSEIDNLSSINRLSDSFAYLAESYGMVTNINGHEIGLCHREYVPRPQADNNRLILPFFSLFAQDKLKDDPSLLTQMLCNNSDPLNYFLDHIISLVIEAFRTIVEDAGLWPENHAQNILLEVDRMGDPTRIVHRDLYEFYPDIQIRNGLGLSSDLFEKTMDEEKDEDFYYKQKSYLFDFKLGNYVLMPLVCDFCKNFNYPKDKVIGKIKEIFNSNTSILKQLLPCEKSYCLPSIENTYKDGRPLFQDFGSPVFR